MKLINGYFGHSVLFEYLFAVATMVAFTFVKAVAQAPSDCTAPTIFSQCLENEEIYLKTCAAQDFACLCKWNMAKLSCWDNCPSDPSRATQAGVVENVCAIASANAPSLPPSASVSSVGESPSNNQNPVGNNNNSMVSSTVGIIPTAAPSALSTTSNAIGLQAISLSIQILAAIIMVLCVLPGIFTIFY